MKVDRRPVMFPVPKAAGHFLYHLNLAIETLGQGIGDPVFEVGHHVGQMPHDGLCRFGNRLQL